jgi:hypothetical protein
MILGSDGRAKPFLSPSSFDNLSLLLLIAYYSHPTVAKI